MSILSDCCTPCPSVPAVNVPGSPGSTGLNAFTTLTAPITLPAQNATVIVTVANTQWLAVGQIVFASDGTHLGTFSVVSVPAVAPFTSATLKFLLYATDSAQGQIIATGSLLTPAGIQAAISYPTSVVNGGTGATTASTARSNLGAAANGANSDITSLNALSTPLSLSQGGTGVTTVAALLALLVIQTGTATLSGGTFTVSTKNITNNSIILVGLKVIGGTRTSWAGYNLTSITNGTPGSFIITAVSDAGATLGSCTDTVYYHIIG